MAEEEGGQQERELEDALGQVDELIEKGQHADAQRACRELLGAHPTSAAVHEKMGDILHHRELWQDAAEWYDLAAQLADTPGLQAKISVAESRAKEARLGGPEPEELAARAAARQRTLLLLLGLAAVLTAVVAVVVAIRLVRGPKVEAPLAVTTTPAAVAGPRTSRLTGPHAARGIRSSPRAPGRATRAQENPEQHWAAEEAPPRPPQTLSRGTAMQEIADPVTDMDERVIAAVSSLTWRGAGDLKGRVAAMVFPYTGYAVISVTIPGGVPEGNLFERVVRQAHRICLTAVRAEEGIRYVTIRMLKTIGSSKEPVTAFQGNTTRKVLQQYPDSSAPFDVLWSKVFASVWWNPQVGGGLPVGSDATSQAGLP